MKLLVDVGQFPTRVFEEGLANEDERACEDVEKQYSEKDGECPAVLAKYQRPIWDQEFQLSHEIEGDGEKEGNRQQKGVCSHDKTSL